MARTIGGRQRGGRTLVRRRVTPGESFRTQVLQRSKFSQNIVQQKRQAKRDADLANKYIADINAGKIKNISQIPQRLRGVIGVTQTELNKINSYVAAKREADLWKQAFWLADRALQDSRGIFAIAWSTNPYAKTAWAIARDSQKAYAERKKSIEAIIRGDIDNVKIVGGRIVDLDTNKFITPQTATAKQFYTTLQKDLPSSEKLIRDSRYNITGIESGLLKQSFAFTDANIKRYNTAITNLPISFKELIRKRTVKEIFTVKKLPFGIKIGEIVDGYRDVRLPNGKTIKVRASGTVIINEKRAGKRLLFRNGSIISIDNKLVSGASGTKPTLTVTGVPKPTTRSGQIIKTLNDLQGKASTASIRNQQSSLNNELSLLGLTTVVTVVNGAIAFKEIPSTVSTLVKNPSQLKQVPAAIRQGGENFINLMVVSPTEAIGVVAGEVLLFKGTGLTFRLAGRLSSKVLRLIKPSLRGMNKVAVIVNGKVIKISRRLIPKNIGKKMKIIKAKQVAEIGKWKSRVAYGKQLELARKARKLARKKGIKTIGVGSDDYVKGVAAVEDFADNLATVRAKAFIRKFKARGGKLGLGQEDDFIRKVKAYTRTELNKMAAFKKLKNNARITKPELLRLKKLGRIESARKLFNTISKRTVKIPFPKKLESIIRKVAKVSKASSKKIVGKARKLRSAVKKAKKIRVKKKVAKVEKLKSMKEYKAQLSRARKARAADRKKGIRSLGIGNDDYTKAVASLEDFADNYGKIRAKAFIRKFKARGGKLGLGQEEAFIKQMQRHARKELNKLAAFKKLQDTARLTKPSIIKLRKLGRLERAGKLFNSISKKTVRIPFPKRLEKALRRVGRVSGKAIKKSGKGIKKARRLVRKAKRARTAKKAVRISNLKRAKEFKKDLKLARKFRAKGRKKLTKGKKVIKIRKPRKPVRKMGKRTSRRRFIRSKKYKMVSEKRVRRVTFQQLERSRSVNDARKVVDNVYDEVARRAKVDMTNLKYRQLKNSIKKQISLAIKRGDKVAIAKFKANMKTIINELNSQAKKPTVTIINKKTRKIRTIKDFTPDAPKGKYIEVKKGGQVLIQKVEQVKKPVRIVKQVDKIKQIKVGGQVFETWWIDSVVYKPISIDKLTQYLTYSLSKLAFENIPTAKIAGAERLSVNQVSGLLSKTSQDFRTLQATSPASATKVAQDVAQKIKQKTKQKTKQKAVTKPVKKKKVILRLKEKKRKAVSVGKKVIVYNVTVKKGKRFMKQNKTPLKLNLAKDLMAYILDNTTSRTGKIIPVGMAVKGGSVASRVAGYYSKNRRKFRVFKIRKGKRIALSFGWIEKRKYALDKKKERKKNGRSKRRKVKRKVVKRKPIKRKPVKRKVVKRKKVRKPMKRKKIVRRKRKR